MGVKLLCCSVFKEEIALLILPEGMEVEYISMGLHLHPHKLHQEIQEAVDKITDCSLLILGFGLCGGALDGIKAPNCPLILPNTHDCIPLLLGSNEHYNSLYAESNRTFYFSGGWVEDDRMMIQEYERSCNKFGPQKALRIFRMMFENYYRIMYIHTGHPRTTATLEETRNFAKSMELPCFETRGNLAYLQKLIDGPWDKPFFVTVPPNGYIKQDAFLDLGIKVIQGG